jgi:hypothetical protein
MVRKPNPRPNPKPLAIIQLIKPFDHGSGLDTTTTTTRKPLVLAPGAKGFTGHGPAFARGFGR